MRRTWNKAVHSLDTGILALGKFTFGKAAFTIVLIAFLHNLVYLPFKVRSARQMKHNAEKLKEIAPAIKEIEDKYKVEPGQRLMAADVRRKGKEIQRLQKEAGISFSTGCLIAMLPVLSGVVIEQAVAGIKSDERFKDEGILWFEDLTRPERFFVLTASMLGLSYLKQRAEIAAFKRPGEVNSKWSRRMRTFGNWLPLGAFGLALITRKQQPSGVVLYNIASSGFSLAETFLIKKVTSGDAESS